MYGISEGASRFIKHGPCEACGSKDNVAWYANGTGFCFGCGKYYTSPSGSVADQRRSATESTGSVGSGHGGGNPTDRKLRSPPDDCGFEFSARALEWVGKYELDASNLIAHNVMWSPSREQLVYLFYGEGSDVILWQARNMREGTEHKRRFFTNGSPANVIATYHGGETKRTATIVEDCISGIKVSMSGVSDGVPAFSAAVSLNKVAGLARLYDEVNVWLDSDKFSEAVKLSNQFKMMGCKSRVFSTSFDPKEYNLYEIGTLLTP